MNFSIANRQAIRLTTVAAAAVTLVACGGGEYDASTAPSISLDKPARYSVGGTISGLGELGEASALFLTLNSTDYDVFTTNGSFTLSTKLAKGATYSVGWQSPAGYDCTVTNGTGTIGRATVTNVAVTCVAQTPIVVQYQVTGLQEGESVTLNAGGFALGTITANGTYPLPSSLLTPFTQFNFGVTSPNTAGCVVPDADVNVFVLPEPNPRTLQVNC